jgi:hypothetical protein
MQGHDLHGVERRRTQPSRSLLVIFPAPIELLQAIFPLIPVRYFRPPLWTHDVIPKRSSLVRFSIPVEDNVCEFEDGELSDKIVPFPR